MRVSICLLLMILICVQLAQARIYTCKDKDGNTVYSDTPIAEGCSESEEVKVDSLPTLIETKPLVTNNSSSSKQEASDQVTKSDYSSLVITTPSAAENVRSNEGTVNITFESTPLLETRRGHQFVVMMGDKEIYKGTQNNVELKNVDRGTHIITAKIVARNGRTIISSEPIEFTLHRYSQLQGNPESITPEGANIRGRRGTSPITPPRQ